jgi:hypothetical protein
MKRQARHAAGRVHVAAHCDADLAARFAALAASHDKTRSAFLQEIIRHVVRTNAAGPGDVGDQEGAQTTRARSNRVRVSLAADEHAAAARLAEADGRTLPQWLRVIVRKATTGAIPFNPAELTALRDVVLAVGPIGRNLNTVAKFYRQTGRVEPDSIAIETLTKQCNQLRAEVAAMIDRASLRVGVGDE